MNSRSGSEPAAGNRLLLALVSCLVLLTTLAYAPVLGNDFVDLDDGLYVTENSRVLAGLSADGFLWAWTTFHAGFWLPLTWLSLQLDASLFGTDAWGFHLTNLILHLANVVLLFWVVRHMTGKTWESALVAALFAVHPLHVESVAWVTERKDVLSTFFCMLTLAGYAHYTAAPSWRRYLEVVVPFALGLLAKPMLVTLPFALLLLDVWPLRRLGFLCGPAEDGPVFRSCSWQHAVFEKIPLFLLAALGSVITFLAQQGSSAVLDWTAFPLEARLSNAVESYALYLLATIWPENLGVFYPLAREVNVAGLVLSLIILSAITAACIWQARACPAWLIGWLWFLGTLVPVIGLVQVGEQGRADRFAYIPHIGLFLGIVFGLSDLARRWKWSTALCAVLAGSMVLLLALGTWFQAGYWQNGRTLWEHTLAATGENYRAHFNLGLIALGEGKVDQAREHFEKSLALLPNQKTHHELGLIYMGRGEYRRAAGHFQEVLRIPSEAARAHKNLGVCWLNLQDWSRAQEHFQQALSWQRHFENWQNLGLAYLMAGDVSKAKSLFATALVEAGNNAAYTADAHFRLGLAAMHTKEWQEAQRQFLEADRLRPGQVSYLHHAAYVCTQLGKNEESNELYRRSLEIEPNWPTAAAHRAMWLGMHAEASHRSPLYALQLAEQACQATSFRRPDLLDILGGVQAAAGDFKAAEQSVGRALELSAQPAERQRLQEHLTSFQNQKPLWLPAP
jgi:protein O-mannosyl-transferase